MNHIDTILVGGRQAGLAASYYRKQARLPHLIFERSLHGATSGRVRLP
jgi:cation diffusion facilitator CzcD-associated flavoprotein CzcO